MSDTFRAERTAVMATAMQQSSAWPAVFQAGSALTLAEAAYDAVAPERFAARQTELLEANNRYLDRARALSRGMDRAADMLETGSKMLVAEDDLADAHHTLGVSRSVMADVASDLRLAMRLGSMADMVLMAPIPIAAAREIAERYGYDQVIIVARRCHDTPEPHGEHVTTYGRNAQHCSVAARIGNFLKFKVMGWAEEDGHHA